MENTQDIRLLYHYTSLDKLALILKNKTIRLSPLDKMDDLQEQKTADVPNAGKFIFVSAWTSEEIESIPMWFMYTDPKAGVRIGLPPNPFKRHKISIADYEKRGLKVVRQEEDPAELDCFLDPVEMLINGYISPQAFGGDILHRVNYTNDLSLLEPKIRDVTGDKINGYLGKLGKHKNKFWEFQKEWRYLMQFLPMRMSDPATMEKEATVMANKLLWGLENPPLRYYDLEIDPTCFSQMEIVISPQMTPGNHILLSSLVEKYNPTATLKSSNLLNLI